MNHKELKQKIDKISKRHKMNSRIIGVIYLAIAFVLTLTVFKDSWAFTGGLGVMSMFIYSMNYNTKRFIRQMDQVYVEQRIKFKEGLEREIREANKEWEKVNEEENNYEA